MGLNKRLLAKARTAKMPKPVVLGILSSLKRAVLPTFGNASDFRADAEYLQMSLDFKHAIIVQKDGMPRLQRGTLELKGMTPEGTFPVSVVQHPHSAAHEFPHPHLG